MDCGGIVQMFSLIALTALFSYCVGSKPEIENVLEYQTVDRGSTACDRRWSLGPFMLIIRLYLY